MAEFHRVAQATYGPTKCVFCGDHEPPFIDTHLDLDVYGHVYVCTSTDSRSGCVQQMARLDGMLLYEDVKEGLEITQETITQLSADLEEARANRVVSMQEVLEILAAEAALKEVFASGDPED